jgi:hypothetical protein
MTGNTGFPEPWPATVPPLAQLQTDLTNLRSVSAATSAGDRTRIPERDAARQTVQADLQKLAFYVQLVANGDATLLATTGFDVKQPPVRSLVAVPLGAPTEFRLKLGEVSGMLVATARRLPGAGSYEVQLATADPTVETNWSSAGIFVHCKRIELTGLTPGKVYSVRLRGIGVAGTGAWAPAASLMAN